jgi:uncharacterized protein
MKSRSQARSRVALLAAFLWVPVLVLTAQEPARGPDREGKDYYPFPNPDAGYVTDIAGLLTPDEEERIERWLWQVESKRGVEIIVVTIRSIRDYPGAPSGSIESFAQGLFDKYGIGNMPENNGVLLLVASKDRKARIELGAGYGRSRDGDARRIMSREIVPRFKGGDYPAGIIDGVRALIREFASLRIGFPWHVVGMAALIVVLVLVAISLFRNGKRGWGWVTVGLIVVLTLVLIRMVTEILRHMPEGHSSGWSSGGLGGFGGGFSGGGGATGSW